MSLDLITDAKGNLIEIAIASIGILAVLFMFIPKDCWLKKQLDVFGQIFGFLGNIFRK